MSKQLIDFLENDSLTILREALTDVRAHGGPTLQSVSDDDLQVALYTVQLKILDALRERISAESTTAPRDMRSYFLEQIKEIMSFVDSQSSYTVGHTPAVVRHAVQIASRLGLNDAQIDDIEYAAWIHNIGLINQSQGLENSPRRLSSDEVKAARNHTTVGAEIIRPINFLSHLVPIVRYHHHPFDGSSGEPCGEAIPLGARIISLADAYQAMIEPRAYRPALTRQEALLEIVKNSGIQFDPQLVPLAHELT